MEKSPDWWVLAWRDRAGAGRELALRVESPSRACSTPWVGVGGLASSEGLVPRKTEGRDGDREAGLQGCDGKSSSFGERTGWGRIFAI